jgi:GNAT superfamily N-acetyltransferase
MSASVRLAGDDDLDAMCAALAAAFDDDPVMLYLLAPGAGRPERLRRFFLLLTRLQHLPHGGCYTTEDRAGGALWDPPGHWKMPNRAVFRALPSLLSVLGARSITALRALSQIERLHPAEPHWYLAVLGTAPAHQGRGIGSALLAPVLGICDRDGLPAYLESSRRTTSPSTTGTASR